MRESNIRSKAFILLKGVGHEIPSAIMPEAVEAVLKHIGEN